ncbi:fatty acid hydroxylase domain-containing protein 2 [Nephila pilipes]|uniref:Fatty acid hydroxylase domain-containing protein 2 n=1 Tax=Nephila pilipes TaxID=299642 RepID=A0A8X6Q075_NEPPI|nr:fatty acid hydroxylase domain-containing protein 2 [Nephila pilipes]
MKRGKKIFPSGCHLRIRFQKVWTTMESFLIVEDKVNEVWLSVYNQFRGNGIILYVVVPQFLMISMYWIVGVLFSIVDFTGKPHFISKYRVPDPTANSIPRITTKRLLEVIFQVACNQFIVGSLLFLSIYSFKKHTTNTQGFVPLRIQRFFGEILFAIIAEEILFYYLHRILHHRSLYKHFHKKHHEFTSPIAISAIYCHPVEHVLSNLLPVLAPWILINAHVLSIWTWVTLTSPLGVMLHSGYHLPLAQPPEFHHYHHMKFNENYGILGFLDWFHETDKEYRKSEWYERAVFLIPADTTNIINYIRLFWKLRY